MSKLELLALLYKTNAHLLTNQNSRIKAGCGINEDNNTLQHVQFQEHNQ